MADSDFFGSHAAVFDGGIAALGAFVGIGDVAAEVTEQLRGFAVIRERDATVFGHFAT